MYSLWCCIYFRLWLFPYRLKRKPYALLFAQVTTHVAGLVFEPLAGLI